MILSRLCLLILFILISRQAFAQNDESVLFTDSGPIHLNIVCDLRNTRKMDCGQVMNQVFQEFRGVVVQDVKNPVVTVNVTDELGPEPGSINFIFNWMSNENETQVSNFKYARVVNEAAADSITVLNTILKEVSKGIVVYGQVLGYAIKDQEITIRASGTGAQSPAPGSGSWLDRVAKSPWYGSINGSGMATRSGTAPLDTRFQSMSVSSELSYFKPKFKIAINGRFQNRKTVVPTGSGYLSAEVPTQSLQALFVYSLNQRWSVAAIPRWSSDRVSNVNGQTEVSTGIEYSLVPFRTTENHEISFRVGPKYTGIHLASENEFGNVDESLVSAFAQIYLYWLFQDGKWGYTLLGSADKTFNYGEVYSAGVFNSLSYQINAMTRVGVSGAFSYNSKSLTYPKAPDFSNPILASSMGGQAGRSTFLQLTLSMMVGNSRLKIRDRRWLSTEQ